MANRWTRLRSLSTTSSSSFTFTHNAWIYRELTSDTPHFHNTFRAVSYFSTLASLRIHSSERFLVTSSTIHPHHLQSINDRVTISFSSSSSSSSLTSTTEEEEEDGEECYQQALNAFQNSKNVEMAKERSRAEELHASMTRHASPPSSTTTTTTSQADEVIVNTTKKEEKRKNREAGVAVIRTIVRQANQAKDEMDNNDKVEDTHNNARRLRRQRRSEEDRKRDDSNDSKLWENKGRELLVRAALRYDHPKALVRLGNDILNEMKNEDDARPIFSSVIQNEYWQQDSSLAVNAIDVVSELYQMAGEGGSSEGWFNLGHLLWTGFPPQDEESITKQEEDEEQKSSILLSRNEKQSLVAFQKAIDLNDADAMYFLGSYHLLQEDNDSLKKGLDLINRSADQNHGPALHHLSLLYLNGHVNLGITASTDNFRKFLDQSCQSQDVDALYLRGSCYVSGQDGYEQNCGLALKDWIESAKMGNADAAVSVGAIYYHGMNDKDKNKIKNGGVKRDRRKAFEYYQMAADMGSLVGWKNVAACYKLGDGVPRDERMAQYIVDTLLN